jgi:YHS domain-containing protein
MFARFIARLLLLALSTFAAHAALAGEFFEKDGAALRGYDPVAYFTAAEPQKGLPDISYDYKGSRFLFANAENRRVFMQSPEKYAPQFGGYCAYGTAQDYKVSTEPDAFAVVDGKLYLNYNRNVRTIWQQDVPGNIARAEKNWPEVAKSPQKD